MKNQSVFDDLDLNDGTFLSLTVKNEILSININRWNNEKITICFYGLLRFTFNTPDCLCELNYVSLLSKFMKEALAHRYAKIPTEPNLNFPLDHPYHHYQLLDVSGNSVLEIIAETANYKELV